MPNNEEFQKAMANKSVLAKKNPEDFYDIGEVLGEGGYARVATVKRKEDGK
jgi:serine/threonine protein kinase